MSKLKVDGGWNKKPQSLYDWFVFFLVSVSSFFAIIAFTVLGVVLYALGLVVLAMPFIVAYKILGLIL